MDWIEFAMAMGLFMVSHRLPAWMGVKERMITALGAQGYMIAFSVVSLGLLWWVVVAAGRAPFVPVWDHEVWHRWVVNLVMPGVAVLAAYGIAAPNPFAFEGRATGFDPARPGIAGVTRQPLLWALALWAGVHLLANGDLAHVLLFAPFLGLALAWRPAGWPSVWRLGLALGGWTVVWHLHAPVIGVWPGV
ncbi:MAG: NnrU family protein [Tabrizicola sp.]|nr:NnrU family protein [Tabrizicola sp.]